MYKLAHRLDANTVEHHIYEDVLGSVAAIWALIRVEFPIGRAKWRDATVLSRPSFGIGPCRRISGVGEGC